MIQSAKKTDPAAYRRELLKNHRTAEIRKWEAAPDANRKGMLRAAIVIAVAEVDAENLMDDSFAFDRICCDVAAAETPVLIIGQGDTARMITPSDLQAEAMLEADEAEYEREQAKQARREKLAGAINELKRRISQLFGHTCDKCVTK